MKQLTQLHFDVSANSGATVGEVLKSLGFAEPVNALMALYAGRLLQRFNTHHAAVDRVVNADQQTGCEQLFALGDHLQQMQLIKQVPIQKSDRQAIKRHMIDLQQKVNVYMASVSTDLSQKIEHADVLDDELMQNVSKYLEPTFTQPSWIVEFKLFAKVVQPVIDALGARLTATMTACGHLSLLSGDAHNIQTATALLQTLNTLQPLVNTYLPAQNQALEQAQQGLQQKVTTTLDTMMQAVSAEAETQALSDQLYTQQVPYLVACQKSPVFTDLVKVQLKNLGTVLTTRLQKRVAFIQQNSQQIFCALFPDDLSSVTIECQATLQQQVEELVALQTEMQELQTRLGTPFPDADALQQTWHVTLASAVERWQTALETALGATIKEVAAADVQAGEGQYRITQLLTLTTALMPLDVLFGSDYVDVTFKALQARFTEALEDTIFKDIQAVMSAFNRHDYPAAVEASLKIAKGSEPFRAVVAQITASLNRQMELMQSQSTELLGESKLNVSPTCMQSLQNRLATLHATEALFMADLMPSVMQGQVQTASRNAKQALDHWFSLQVARISGLMIDELKLHQATEAMRELKQTLSCMSHYKLQHAENGLHDLETTLQRLLQTLVQQFAHASSSWQPHGLPAVNQACEDAQQITAGWPFESSTGNNPFVNLWQQISPAAQKTLVDELSALPTAFEASHTDIPTVLKSFFAVAEQLQGVSYDPENLLPQVKAQACRSMQTVQTLLLATLQTSQQRQHLVLLKQWLQAQPALQQVFGAVDNAAALDFMSGKVELLRGKVSSALQSGQLDFSALEQLVGLQQIFPDYAVIKSVHSALKDQVNVSVTHHVAELGALLSAYESGQYNQNKPVFFASLNQLLQYFSEVIVWCGNQAEHASILPASLTEQLLDQLADYHQYLAGQTENYAAAVSNRETVTLETNLQFLKDWQQTFVYLNGLLQKLPTGEQSLLKQLIQRMNLQAYADTIKRLLTEIAMHYAGLSVTQLFAGDTSTLARQEFYQQLLTDLQFMQQAKVLAAHVDHETDVSPLCVKNFSSYLQKVLNQAEAELDDDVMIKDDWSHFGLLYNELKVFAEKCHADAILNKLVVRTQFVQQAQPSAANAGFLSGLLSKAWSGRKVDQTHLPAGQVYACQAVQLLGQHFATKLEPVYARFSESRETDTAAQADIVAFLVLQQKLISQVPMFATILTTRLNAFLQDMSQKQGKAAIHMLASALQDEESGYGAELIRDQSVFRSIAISLRNQKMQAQGIEYVLNNTRRAVDGGQKRPLSVDERTRLTAAFSVYETTYKILLHEQLVRPELRTAANPYEVLSPVNAAMQQLIADANLTKDADGHVVFDQKFKALLPRVAAHLFAIWTLRDAKPYLDAMDDAEQENLMALKTPHPAQLVALFCEFGLLDNNSQIRDHLVELQSGEGKSVTLAATNLVLAIMNRVARHGCYSDYLTQRDFADFKGMFDFTGQAERIQYGTLDQIVEGVINSTCDLRQAVKNLLEGKPVPIATDTSIQRRTLVTDEVDVLFNENFFGSLYQPFFTWHNPEVKALLDSIWQQRHANPSVNTIKTSRAYRVCLSTHQELAFLVEAALPSLLSDLKAYTPEQGHEYVVRDNKIMYRYQDGLVDNMAQGYKTLWAYYHQQSIGGLSKAALEGYLGLRVNCGAFSYADQTLMRSDAGFSTIIGATGTLSELTQVEHEIICDHFGIRQETYIPSVYGNSQLAFNTGTDFTVIEDAFYYQHLEAMIKQKLGSGSRARAVLVFFDSEVELRAFLDASVMRTLRSQVNIIAESDKSSVAERNAKIRAAMRQGAITFTTKRFARGTDFMCMDQRVIRNDGVAGISAFYPEEKSLEVQLLRRMARQGQPGSANFVLRQSDILRDYGEDGVGHLGLQSISQLDIENAKASGGLYALLDKAREAKFSAEYRLRRDKIVEVSNALHTPSMQLLQKLQRPGVRLADIANELKVFNQPMQQITTSKTARVIVAMDGTGSMWLLLETLKGVMQQVMTLLPQILQAQGYSSEAFALMLMVYRNYNASFANLLDCSEWTRDPRRLQADFLELKLDTDGGYGGREAGEVALHEINTQAETSEGVDRVLIIGDQGFNNHDELKKRCKDLSESTMRQYYGAGKPVFWETELQGAIKQKGVSIDTRYLYNPDFSRDNAGCPAEPCFKKMADMTGGTCERLDMDDKKQAASNVANTLARTVFMAATDGDVSETARMMGQFTKSFSR